MSRAADPLSGLRNLGEKSAELLREVGIETPEALREAGAVLAYKILKHRFPKRLLNYVLCRRDSLPRLVGERISVEIKAPRSTAGQRRDRPRVPPHGGKAG